MKWTRTGKSEYTATTAAGSRFVVSRAAYQVSVAHPLTGRYREVTRSYWSAAKVDERGCASPEFYGVRSSTLAEAKRSVERYAVALGL